MTNPPSSPSEAGALRGPESVSSAGPASALQDPLPRATPLDTARIVRDVQLPTVAARSTPRLWITVTPFIRWPNSSCRRCGRLDCTTDFDAWFRLVNRVVLGYSYRDDEEFIDLMET